MSNAKYFILTKGMLDEIRREAELMERLSHHPNIISFVGAITKTHQDFRSFALIVRPLHTI